MRTKLFLILLALFCTTSAVQAQGARVGIYRGVSEYDLSGVDQATVTALRVGYDFGRVFGLEAGLASAAVEQQFGDTRLYLPDVQV